MNILSIDTSGKISAAILSTMADDGKIKTLSKKIINHVATQSQTILPAIDDCLSKSKDKNYDALALCTGPGSFTGLRVGAATIKGFAFAGNLKIVPISSLEALALNIAKKDVGKNDKNFFKKNQKWANIIIPMIDARASRVYFSIFDNNLNRYMQDDHIEINSLLDAIKIQFKSFKYKTNFIFVGDGATVYKKTIKNSLKALKNTKITFGNPKENSSIIESIATLAFKNFEKDAVYSENLKLNYLQASQAERNLKK